MLPIEVNISSRLAPPDPYVPIGHDLRDVPPPQSIVDVEVIAVKGGERFRFHATGTTMSVSRMPASTEDELVARIVEAARQLAKLDQPEEPA